MHQPISEVKTTARELIARHQETTEKLIATVGLNQRQIDAPSQRIQNLEGVPFPEHEPPQE